MTDSEIRSLAGSAARSRYTYDDIENRAIFKAAYIDANNQIGIGSLHPREETVDIQYNMSIFERAWATDSARTSLLVEYASNLLCSNSHIRWVQHDNKVALKTTEFVLHADVTKCISFFRDIGFLDTLVRTLKTAERFNLALITSDVTLYDEKSNAFTISSYAFQQAVACINIDYKSKGEFNSVITFK